MIRSFSASLSFFLLAPLVACAAIAVDVNKSTDRTASSTTVASPVFSTAGGNELLLAFVAADYLSGDKWIMQYQPAAKEAVARLKQGTEPALSRLTDRCAVLKTDDVVLIAAECVMNVSRDEQGVTDGSRAAPLAH